MNKLPLSNKSARVELVIAQFSDSHLFADINSLHYGANVYHNLRKVLSALAQDKTIDVIIFTGDLTQDHSEQSYVNFVEAVKFSGVEKPIYFLAGNHDEYDLLNKFLVNTPFNQQKLIETEHWQIGLLNSKSATPAGFISEQSLQQLRNSINTQKKQILFTHHHPVDVNYFIDKHGLENKPELWQTLSEQASITAIACGHVHRALDLTQILDETTVRVLTCPATSIQFDPRAKGIKALPRSAEQGIGYRHISLFVDGEFTTTVHFCEEFTE